MTVGLADVARHILGCRVNHETRVSNVLNDVAISAGP
jgi:hypothetical protein